MSRSGSREDDTASASPSASDWRGGGSPRGAITAPGPAGAVGEDDNSDDDLNDNSHSDNSEDDRPDPVIGATPAPTRTTPIATSSNQGRDDTPGDNTNDSITGSFSRDRRRGRGGDSQADVRQGRSSNDLPSEDHAPDDITGLNTGRSSSRRSELKGYTFDVDSTGLVTNLMKVRGPRSRAERIDANETWRYDGTQLIQEETKVGGTEITTYTSTLGGLFTRASETFVPFSTTPASTPPVA